MNKKRISNVSDLDPRVQKNSESMVNLANLLRDVAAHPHNFFTDQALLSALYSQGSLAKYKNVSLYIFSSSINTMKRNSKMCFEDGFSGLDQLRKAALAALESQIENEKKSSLNTKSALREEIKSLEKLVELVRGDCWHLSRALLRALHIGRVYAERTGEAAMIENCRKEQQDILKIFKLCNQMNISPPSS